MEKKFNIDEEFFNERMQEAWETYPTPSPKPGTRIGYCVDVGANVGAFSILFSKYCDKVIAIEPYKPNYDFMVNKIKELKIDNIITYNKAISSKDGEIIDMNITTHESDSKDISTANPEQWENHYSKDVINLGSVETISYSYIHKNYPHIGYMKVDCEGCEYDFLMGSPLKNVQLLTLEVHSGYIGKKKKIELLNYLETQFKTMFPNPQSNDVLNFLNIETSVTFK